MKNFYFFGDSICFGQYVSVEKTFVHRVAKFVNERSRDEYCFMNPSVINNTTVDALQRFHHDVLFRKPDIIYIQFGLNDCNVWVDRKGQPRVPHNNFIHNLECLVKQAQAFGAKVILGNNHPTNKEELYNESVQRYNAGIMLTADNCRVPLVDNYMACKVCAENFDHLLPDGIHLSEKGHVIYADSIISKII